MKIVERVIESIIRSSLMMKYGFMPICGTMDTTFIQQMPEKHLGKHKLLYFAFADLKKAFDKVPSKINCWVMQKLGIEEWKITFAKAMYADAAPSICINKFSEKFGTTVKVGPIIVVQI